MVPANARVPSIELSTRSPGWQSSQAVLGAQPHMQISLARLHFDAREKGLLLIAEWLGLARQQFTAGSHSPLAAFVEAHGSTARNMCEQRHREVRHQQATRSVVAGD